MTTKPICKTQWHIIVAALWKTKEWTPTFRLQSVETEFGFIGSSGEQRVRELARNDACIPAELVGKIEKKREGKFEYFRYRPQLSPVMAAAERVRRFDAGLPAAEVLAV
jgi:hypothetical protein